MNRQSNYFDPRHSGGAAASSGMTYQDSCAVLIIMKNLGNDDFSSIGLEASNDITLCVGGSQKHIQTKDRKLTFGLLKSILEGAVLDRQDIIIMASSVNEEVDSLLSKLVAYRSHQAHAPIGGPDYVAIERDFDQELILAGLLELKEALLSSTVWVQPSHGLEAVVEAELVKWARAHGSFICEQPCLLEFHGTLSRARSNRIFLTRHQVTELLSRHLVEPSKLTTLLSPIRSQFDSSEAFRSQLRRRSDLAARFEQKLILAEGYELQQEFLSALKIYQALDVILQDSDWLLIRCAALSERLGDLPQAEDYAKKALKLNSKAFGALFVLGTVAGELNHLDDALGYFHAAEYVNDADAKLLHNIGYTLLRMGDQISALEYFEKAAAAPDAEATSHLNAGVVLFTVGRYKEAEVALKLALQLEPNMPEALSQLGELHRFFGNLDAAIPMFNRALKSLPDNLVAKLGLALSMLERGGTDSAKQLVMYFAGQLKELTVGRATVILDIGWHRTFPILITRIDDHCFEVRWDSFSETVNTADIGTV